MTCRRVYISIPKKTDRDQLSQMCQVDHGLLITELNPIINEGYMQAYFRQLGFHTACMIKNYNKDQSVAFVRFASADEADRADWDGPHCIGGTEVKTRRVVSPKIEDKSFKEQILNSSKCPRRPPMALGYILEDPQWLDENTE